jgi:hypothetical protein
MKFGVSNFYHGANVGVGSPKAHLMSLGKGFYLIFVFFFLWKRTLVVVNEFFLKLDLVQIISPCVGKIATN